MSPVLNILLLTLISYTPLSYVRGVKKCVMCVGGFGEFSRYMIHLPYYLNHWPFNDASRCCIIAVCVLDAVDGTQQKTSSGFGGFGSASQDNNSPFGSGMGFGSNSTGEYSTIAKCGLNVIGSEYFIYCYVAAKATYIRLLYGQKGFFFSPSSVKRGRTHIVFRVVKTAHSF